MDNEKHRYKELGEFLKARRAKISPAQAGIYSISRRRTPGLRREEVAQLAGVSLSWYTWLEQGREIHVSTQIIESLSRVLMLDQQERIYVHLLANQPLPEDIPGFLGKVSPVLQRILDSLVTSPSMVMDLRWNVVAWNKAACAIFGDFTKMTARERNIVWAMFTDKRYKELFMDWDFHARGLVGRFRASCGQYIEDEWLLQFVHDLKQESPEFMEWWPLQHVESNSEKTKQLNHPIKGILDFEVCNLNVADHSGLTMIVHNPLPETETLAKMKSLIE